MDLHGKIMNLQFKQPDDVAWTVAERQAAQISYRDARHAAAEIALKADACIAALRMLDARLRECSTVPASDADAYDSFYQQIVADALDAVDDA